MPDHITVCICTFRRPGFLLRLLTELASQVSDGSFTHSAVVVDNDSAESARQVVAEFAARGTLPVEYFVEREQSIALARNLAVSKARGDFVAFIDDDEFPAADWLIKMRTACIDLQADGVLAPVVPHYDFKPPRWIVRGRFHDRPSPATGTVLPWRLTRTGNALLRRAVLDAQPQPFGSEFASGGEDRDFFRRMIERGFVFKWYADAPVCESVPAERCTRSFLLRRALLRGKTPYNQSLVPVLKSMVAVPAYVALLPVALVRHDWFMKLLVKCFDHAGRILHLMRIRVVKERYVVK